MQQVSNVLGNNFQIQDQHERPVGLITTTGSLGSRLVMGSRSLQVTEIDGSPVLSITDPVDLFRDTYELVDADGQPLAHLRRRFRFLRTQVDMHLADGTAVELHGNVGSLNYEFRFGDRIPARVSRQWGGLSRALLGRSRYLLSFEPDVPPWLRTTIIGGVVALDLMRAKDSRNSSN